MRTPLTRLVALRALQEEAERLHLEKTAAELRKNRDTQQHLQQSVGELRRVTHAAFIAGTAELGLALRVETEAAPRSLLLLQQQEEQLLQALQERKLSHRGALMQLRKIEVLQKAEAGIALEKERRAEQAALDEWFLLRPAPEPTTCEAD